MQFGERARSKHSKNNAEKEREPWLLASSLNINSKLTKQVKRIYATRMQIEETFRDVKSARFGLGFELNGTYKTKRLQILLLIVMRGFICSMAFGFDCKNNEPTLAVPTS